MNHLCVIYVSFMYHLCVIYVPILYGFCINFVWFLYHLCMVFVSFMYHLCMVFCLFFYDFTLRNCAKTPPYSLLFTLTYSVSTSIMTFFTRFREFISMHETSDDFMEEMNWGELIFKSNKNEMKLWMQNIIDDPNNSFKLLQSILFQGFTAVNCHQALQLQNLHPNKTNKEVHENENDNNNNNHNHNNDKEDKEDKNDTEDVPKPLHNLINIGKDLGVYICQFLPLMDLISFEKTSHDSLRLARNPSAVYSMIICPPKQTKSRFNGIWLNDIIPLRDLSVLGKFRFANLRTLILKTPLYNIPWTQLFHLTIDTNLYSFLPQNKLETLNCNWTEFNKLMKNDIIPVSSLTSLTLTVDSNSVDDQYYLPHLQSLEIESDTWEIGMDIVHSFSSLSLHSLDFYAEECVDSVPLQTIQQTTIDLLQKWSKIHMFISSDNPNIYSNFVSIITNPKNHFKCKDLDISVFLGGGLYIIKLNDKDLMDIKHCKLWKNNIWPNSNAFSCIDKTKLDFIIVIQFPYSAKNGYIYDAENILSQINEEIDLKYDDWCQVDDWDCLHEPILTEGVKHWEYALTFHFNFRPRSSAVFV